jgi:hypothetical protein
VAVYADAAMAKGNTAELRKGETVLAADDLHGVPKGTSGRVMMVSGLRWTRYRVDFVNGTSLGSLDRVQLARPAEFSANGAVTD